MNELHSTGEQRDTAIGIGTTGTILQIALDGTANLGQLTANLVMTARQQLNLQQRVVVAATQHTIAEHCLLGARNLAVVGIRLVLLLVADKPMG